MFNPRPVLTGIKTLAAVLCLLGPAFACPALDKLALEGTRTALPNRQAERIEGRRATPYRQPCTADRAACLAALRAQLAGAKAGEIVELTGAVVHASAEVDGQIVKRSFASNAEVADWMQTLSKVGKAVTLKQVESIADPKRIVALTTEVVHAPGVPVAYTVEPFQLTLPRSTLVGPLHEKLRAAGLEVTRFQPTTAGLVVHLECWIRQP